MHVNAISIGLLVRSGLGLDDSSSIDVLQAFIVITATPVPPLKLTILPGVHNDKSSKKSNTITNIERH